MAMSFERFCFSRRDLYRMSWVVVDPKTFESAARNQSFPAYVGTFNACLGGYVIGLTFHPLWNRNERELVTTGF
jgi:hypothetical protein